MGESSDASQNYDAAQSWQSSQITTIDRLNCKLLLTSTAHFKRSLYRNALGSSSSPKEQRARPWWERACMEGGEESSVLKKDDRMTMPAILLVCTLSTSLAQMA